ncbi:MAG: DUF6119 family protein [Trebonia sp.]
MKQPKTRQVTLHRLVPRVHGTLESMFDALAADKTIRELDPPEILAVAGAPALFFGVQNETGVANWCADASITTGLPLAYTDSHSGGLLVLGVDDTVYAVSYDRGYLLLPDGLKDQRFGLSFLIRSLDAGQVSDIVRRRPDARGRTDSTLIAAGAHVWTLGTVGSAEIIRRIGGKAKDLDVTFRGRSGRNVKIIGAAGLTMRFGVEPEDLVADIRECARVCREVQPDSALEFVEYVHQVTDPSLTGVLDLELDDLLEGASDECLVPVVPTPLLDVYGEAHSLTISVGSTRVVLVATFGLDDLLRCVRNRLPGERVPALRKGCVGLNADDSGTDDLGHVSAFKWFEANVSLGSERYFLMDGDWFQIGTDYVLTTRAAISRLFPGQPSVELPAWSLVANRTEREYNRFVAASRPGEYLCLDRDQNTRHPLGPSTSSLEICDLLGPRNELIHVKRAKGSAPLSHLFQQGLQSAQCLLHGPPDVRERFVKAVANQPHGRTLPADFTPKRVIYAILMENGQQLTPDTLFPFSQASLAHAANVLGPNVEVEVIGVPAG